MVHLECGIYVQASQQGSLRWSTTTTWASCSKVRWPQSDCKTSEKQLLHGPQAAAEQAASQLRQWSSTQFCRRCVYRPLEFQCRAASRAVRPMTQLHKQARPAQEVSRLTRLTARKTTQPCVFAQQSAKQLASRRQRKLQRSQLQLLLESKPA